MQSYQEVRKVENWKKALEDTCKYENISDNGVNQDVEQFGVYLIAYWFNKLSNIWEQDWFYEKINFDWWSKQA